VKRGKRRNEKTKNEERKMKNETSSLFPLPSFLSFLIAAIM